VSTVSPLWRVSHVDRREAVSRRLAATAQLLARIEEALSGTAADAAAIADAGQSSSFSFPDVPDGDVPIDPDGSLRAAVRAVIGVAQREVGFDLRLSTGPDHEWALRLHHGEIGLTAQLVYVPTAGSGGRVIQIAPRPAEAAAGLWADLRITEEEQLPVLAYGPLHAAE
jgi:hypothetical protein